MRIRVVFHYLGLLVATLGFFMLAPLACSLIYGEADWRAFTISLLISVGLGLLLWRQTPAGEGRLSRREAIMIVTGGWILASAFGALPYVLAGTFGNYLDAYFETMSGFTTTGATVLADIEGQFRGILLWRSLSQWLGGMGMITLFVALFPMLGMGAANLVEAEVPGPQAEKLTARIRDTARAVWFIYIGFSVLEILCLWVVKMPLYDALAITFSTMATGGFTPTNLSIGAYNNLPAEIIIIFFMVVGGANFGLYYLFMWKRQPRSLMANSEFRLYVTILAGASIMIALDLMVNRGMAIGEAFRLGSFNTVSIMTTTGFATADFNAWSEFSKTILFILMLVGGSAGSTGGGIKVIRLLALLKSIRRRILLTINPRAVIPLKLGGNVLSEKVTSGIISMSMLYVIVLVVASLALSALGIDQVTAFSAVVASMGTVGPGLGLVGPVANYLWIPPLGKIILMMCMLLGRLELFTVMALVIPSFWKWR
ncbi:TrkH family potassium uptake protein [Chloroflexota bacterium]